VFERAGITNDAAEEAVVIGVGIVAQAVFEPLIEKMVIWARGGANWNLQAEAAKTWPCHLK